MADKSKKVRDNGRSPAGVEIALDGQTAEQQTLALLKRQAESLARMAASHEAIAQELRGIRIQLEAKRRADFVEIEQALHALLRHAYMRGFDRPAPLDLTSERFRISSQNEEDGMVIAIFKRIGVVTRTCVEMACGGNGGNAGVLAGELGWRGLMVDGNPEKARRVAESFAGCDVTVVNAWITRENVNDLLREHGFTGEIDHFGLDIDGNDFWVWQALEVCSPRLMVVEYNSVFGDASVTIPYDPQFDRHALKSKLRAGGYYGASLPALARLGARKGYRLVAVEPRGVNAFFLRDDVGPDIPGQDPAGIFRWLNKENYRRWRDRLGEQDVRAYFEAAGAPLVEVKR